MTLSIWFWVIFVIGVLFDGYSGRAKLTDWAKNSLVAWVLLAILGWAVFGPAIHK